MNPTQKLFNRNFLLVVIGQIISLFGNAILRFALPLYLLNTTGSSAVFGTVLAVSMLPIALLSPIGGIVADRVNRRNIMVALDFITAGFTLLFGVFFIPDQAILLIGILMLLLSAIQSFYSPAVQASVPLLASSDNLIKANAVVNQVQALSSLLGPVIGGILYGVWGLIPIVFVGAISFLISAIMEIFIHIPFERRKTDDKVGRIVKKDMQDSFYFITKEQPIIGRILLVVCAFNLFISSLIMVGTPTLINVTLGLSSQLYGISQGIMAGGALLGGILTGVFSKQLTYNRVHLVLVLAAVCVIPMGVTLLLGLPVMVSYSIITLSAMLLMAVASVFTIMMLSYVQLSTPNALIGKVMSFIIALSTCSQPVGQALYGFLFRYLNPSAIIITAGIIGALIALSSKKTFSGIAPLDAESMG